jgi:ATP-dependent Clp protease protease subunit
MKNVRAPIMKVYATLSGPVEPGMAQRVFTGFSRAVNDKVNTVHLLVHSLGGSISDGVGIYNFLRNLPIQIIAYNGGMVASIAVVMFLAAQKRAASESGTFVVHKSHHTLAAATGEQLELASKGLRIEDERTEKILKSHLKLSPEQWKIHERGNLTITAEEAVKVGLIHEVADFKPPAGSQIFNL